MGHVPPTETQAAPEPVVISPEQHSITIDLIDGDALFVLRKLNKAGYSSYLVGGGVRDLYLNNTPKDFDICTDARPGQIRQLFPNSRTIGRRFRLVQIFFKNGKIIEVATLRSLSEHDLDGPESVLAPNNTFGTLDQDAQRRDLTINALFYEIENQTIIDYVGGVDDLDQSLIRFVGDPAKRIRRDPVRMLRAIRHSARNGFTIEHSCWTAIREHNQMLPLCPPSRLRDELLKDLYSGVASRWFPLAASSGLFQQLFQLYTPLLQEKTDDPDSAYAQLSSLLQVIDRNNTYYVEHGYSRPKDFFLFSLMLLPWAIEKYQLLDVAVKGPDRFQLAKRIRDDLDQGIGIELNLRRSLRQEVVTILINLPFLIHHKRKGFWPKWLKKKSYFKKCSLFYYYYQEAYQGKHIPESALTARATAKSTHSSPSLQPGKKSKRKRRTYSRRKKADVSSAKK